MVVSVNGGAAACDDAVVGGGQRQEAVQALVVGRTEEWEGKR